VAGLGNHSEVIRQERYGYLRKILTFGESSIVPGVQIQSCFLRAVWQPRIHEVTSPLIKTAHIR
jgi:hypothetical protein